MTEVKNNKMRKKYNPELYNVLDFSCLSKRQKEIATLRQEGIRR